MKKHFRKLVAMVLMAAPLMPYQAATAAAHSTTEMEAMQQAYIDINNRLSTFFASVDQRDWNKVLSILDAKLLVDYSSFTGQPAATVAKEDVVKGWSEFLPTFDATHHQIGNVSIDVDGSEAKVRSHITATHFKKGAEGGETQQVIGTYDIAFVHKGGMWHINKLKLNFLFETGNKDLL